MRTGMTETASQMDLSQLCSSLFGQCRTSQTDIRPRGAFHLFGTSTPKAPGTSPGADVSHGMHVVENHQMIYFHIIVPKKLCSLDTNQNPALTHSHAPEVPGPVHPGLQAPFVPPGGTQNSIPEPSRWNSFADEGTKMPQSKRRKKHGATSEGLRGYQGLHRGFRHPPPSLRGCVWRWCKLCQDQFPGNRSLGFRLRFLRLLAFVVVVACRPVEGSGQVLPQSCSDGAPTDLGAKLRASPNPSPSSTRTRTVPLIARPVSIAE